MEGGEDGPHVMDLRSSKDDVVGERVVQHHECHIEVYLAGIDGKSDFPHGDLFLPTEFDENGGLMMDVEFDEKSHYQQELF